MSEGIVRGTTLEDQLNLIEQGYEPVPILAHEKRPLIVGWTAGDITEERLKAWRDDHPDHTSTGCRTGKLAMVDNDLLDSMLAEQVQCEITRVLGETPCRRYGAKPEPALAFFNESPIPKIIVSCIPLDEDRVQRVEFFGTGGQMVTHGIHQTTGKPYRWTKDILDVEYTELPEVSPDLIRRAAGAVADLLKAAGCTDVKITGSGVNDYQGSPVASEDLTPVAPEWLCHMFEHVKHDGMDLREWIGWLCVWKYTPLVDAETGEPVEDFDRFQAFCDWSADGCGKYEGFADCLKHWNSKKEEDQRKGSNAKTVASLVQQAKTNGYTGPTFWQDLPGRVGTDVLMKVRRARGSVDAPKVAVGQPNFQRTKEDTLCRNYYNALEAVAHLATIPEYDRFNQRTVLRDGEDTFLVDDTALRTTREDILRVWGLELSKDHVAEAMHTVGIRRPFHPVQELFDSLEWDGVPRLDTWLTTYFGAEDSEYIRTVGRKWLIAGATRIFRPGAKFDNMLIFVGKQGRSKSKALNVLALKDAWFTDSPPEDLRPDNKDAVMLLQGKLIVEFAELSGVKKGNRDTLKAFISRRIDEARVPYGREVNQYPRQCILAGSSNETDFLEDPTGARRFWPVTCGEGFQIDVAGLTRDRFQLWAEAVAAFKRGESVELPEQLWSVAAEVQDEHYTEDPWEAKLKAYLDGPENRPNGQAGAAEKLYRVHSSTLLTHALGLSTAQQTPQFGRRLRPIMENRLGWKHRVTLRIGDTLGAGYIRPDVMV